MGEMTIKTYSLHDGKVIGEEKIGLNENDKKDLKSENLIQNEDQINISFEPENQKLVRKIQPKPDPKPDYIDFQKVKKINFEDDLELETNVLLGIKKKNLEYQFHVLEEQTRNKKTLYEIQNNKNEGYNTKELQIKGCCCCTMDTYLAFNFKLLGPLFVIFHLVGVYQLVNLLESTQNEMMFGIKSFIIKDYNRSNQNMTLGNNTDINHQYENLCFKKIPDFNLLFLSSIIGNLLLKSIGYKFSSLIFMVINSAIILIYNSYDFPKEKYVNFSSVLYIILFYIILYISVGSMALFSQQIYFDGLKKYFMAIYEDEDKIKNQSFFSYLCFTAIPSYFIYIGINYFFKEKYYQNYFLVNIYVYLVFTGLSIIVYFFYSFAFIKVKKIINENISKKYCRICGYLIYQETKNLKPKENTEEKKNEVIIDENNNNPNENIITTEEKEKKIEDETNDDDKIIKEKEGKKEEQEEINLEVDYGNKNISIKNNVISINNNSDVYFLNNNKYAFQDDVCCLSCNLGCRKCYKLIKKSNLLSCICFCSLCENCIEDFPENFGDCCRCKNDYCDQCHEFWHECCQCCRCFSCDCCYCCDCCYDYCSCCSSCDNTDCYDNFCYCDCCCCEIWGKFWTYCFIFISFPFCICCYLRDCYDRNDINELYQEEETFCYCYKIQNCISWCCDLLFKNDVLQIIIIDIYLEVLTLGFGKIINSKLSQNLNSNSLEKNFLIISIYIGYYIIIAIFNSLIKYSKNLKKKKEIVQKEEHKEENPKKKKEEPETNFTDYLWELTGITLMNAFIVTIFSGFSAFGKGKFKEFTDNYLILLPHALTKFYYFILFNSLVKTMDTNNLDLLSNSSIISLFLMIFRLVSSVLVELINIKILLIFQFVFGLIVSIVIIILFICLYYLTYHIYKAAREYFEKKAKENKN